MKRILFFFFILLSAQLAAQTTLSNQDLIAAKPICNPIFSEELQVAGEGIYLNEIGGTADCYTREYADYNELGYWYTFTAQSSGLLKFTISGDRSDMVDYDWIVFDVTDLEPNGLQNNPEAYMLSSNNYGDYVDNQFTGADSNKAELNAGNCNGPGTDNGGPFNEDIPIQEGRIYAIFILNWMAALPDYETTLFTFDASASTAGILDNSAPELEAFVDSEALERCEAGNTLTFTMNENVDCSTLLPEYFELWNSEGKVEIASLESDECSQNAPHTRKFTITTAETLKTDTYTLKLLGGVEDLCGNESEPGELSFDLEEIILNMTLETQRPYCGENNGSVKITANGGVEPYWYSIDGVSFSENSLYENLTPQTYNVQVRDSRDCSLSESVPMEAIPDLVIDKIEAKNLTCFEDNSGEIRIHASGGDGQLWYSLSETDARTTNSLFAGMAAGTYTFRVADDMNCEKTATVTLTQPDELLLETETFDLKCFESNDGQILISSSGGTGIRTEQIFSSDGAEQLQWDRLIAGDYNVIVADENGCEKNEALSISQPDMLEITLNETEHVKCFSEENGKILFTINGGTPDYLTEYKKGEDVIPDLENLGAGTYHIYVIDANNCTATEPDIIITEPEKLDVTTQKENNLCFAEEKGSITVTAEGGTPVYTIVWTDGSNAFERKNLPAATYAATVTDAHACEFPVQIEITQPDDLTLNIEADNLLCFEDKTGKLQAEVSGGVEQYVISAKKSEAEFQRWENASAGTFTASSLGEGDYAVWVTDNNGCIAAKSLTITQPDKLQFNLIEKNPVLCFGDNSGSIVYEILGGTRDFKIEEIRNAGGELITDVSALFQGKYDLFVQDANNCELTADFTITEPDELIVTPTMFEVECYGGNTGRVTLDVQGGVLPYEIAWDNEMTGTEIMHLSAGVYTATVTDQNACAEEVPVTVTQREELAFKLNGKNVTCNGFADAWLEVEFISGSATGLDYVWTTFGEAPIPVTQASYPNRLEELVPDYYHLRIVDELNKLCAVDSVEITEPDVLAIDFTVSNAEVCNDKPEGVMNYSISGGTLPYYETWTEPLGTGEIDPYALYPGVYMLTVEDENGCQATPINFEIGTKVCEPEITIPNIFTPNGDTRNDYFTIKHTNTKKFTCTILGRWGKKIYTWHKDGQAWDGKLWTGAEAGEGSYFYMLVVEGEDGKVYRYKGSLMLTR